MGVASHVVGQEEDSAVVFLGGIVLIFPTKEADLADERFADCVANGPPKDRFAFNDDGKVLGLVCIDAR